MLASLLVVVFILAPATLLASPFSVEAIRQVASLHPDCDLANPGTPSATMVLLRALEDRADYLALADAVLVPDTSDGLQVVSDERVNQLAGKEREAANRVPTGSALKLRRRAQLTRALRPARNRPGGYWVATADPEAARQAVTGMVPGRSLHRAALLSDGASRLVDPFGLATWEELLAESGPDELLRQVRAAEAVDPRAGNGLGPSAATTPPPCTSPWMMQPIRNPSVR